MDPSTGPKEFVLCFDGTGYKFRGNESDSNVLKIFRMLNRHEPGQYHYFQPGFGTFVSTTWLAPRGRANRAKSVYLKAKDAAMGTTFAEHVMGGYRFLMRYYNPGDRIYMFGFSRGAYVARFLAEMLDLVGLVETGNEEMAGFAWKTFAQWQKKRNNRDIDAKKKEELFNYIKAFRETFSRPVSQIRFIGLFDSINSVPRFENTFMQRSMFPYTARTSAKIIRHAVGIDERRAKFRDDLVSNGEPTARSRRAQQPSVSVRKTHAEAQTDTQQRQPSPTSTSVTHSQLADREHYAPDVSDGNSASADSDTEPDIEEVWFAGCHADIGGGFRLGKNEDWALSHVPLIWMVQEAQRAGLRFDAEKLKQFNCYDHSHPTDGTPTLAPETLQSDQTGEKAADDASRFEYALWSASTHGRIHDCLQYGSGLPWTTVLFWRAMEYLPFRRMNLQDDGSWKPVRWPLPLGEVRDIPANAKIHVSAIRRMRADPDYRPGNLIEGGGGRGKRRVPAHRGIGEWEVCDHPGSPVHETYRRRRTATAKETRDLQTDS
ncbi:T6SS phospholipase effector Tle1-like catalytic domain-containing protein [Aspergillus thermomutatus]|uniref:T6SS Phospholipase effector Tle1-like catalytic domain-containing protein n=1 Tax=Aspergillus thermomutatus TaxID=41047 RepID=A0A397GXP3_ASPTH|nr:uncharacterized protein CDV56_106915 [Aspergillus thermomutatus]RHZ55762.1 hypothetical protein CDV56_106915 [Aspergillus thermomutatus]